MSQPQFQLWPFMITTMVLLHIIAIIVDNCTIDWTEVLLQQHTNIMRCLQLPE